jgi:POT family proton-dependent oligopeptide transporter
MSKRSFFVKEGSLASVSSSLGFLGRQDASKRSILDPAKDEANIPSNVSAADQVEGLPDEYKSGELRRPLKATDDRTGEEHRYALRPLLFSASFILALHLSESFSYYGVEAITTPFLVGQYDANWNANLTSVEASSYVSGLATISATVPFVSGALADGLLGDYWVILLGAGLFYIPGLLLLALTTLPSLLGATFNHSALSSALLALCPIGLGLVRPITSVFGAKQFHPVLQSSMIETYYIYYYQAINVGALGGGILIPLVAQINDTAALLAPVGLLALGVALFVLGSGRYVRIAPRRDVLSKTLRVINCCPRFPKSRRSVRAARQLLRVIAVSALTIPFDVAFCQMTTVFSVQALAMRPVGVIDAAMMQNFNAGCGILAGFALGSWLYPALQRRGVKLSIAHRIAIGTTLGAGSIVSAIGVDYAIHRALEAGSTKISILWQAFNYALIGIGELFVLTTSFEATYVIAPVDQKGLATAINMFVTSALPSFLSIGLYHSFSFWFPSQNGLLADSYAESRVYNYLWVLLAIMASGVCLNALPSVARWVEHAYQDGLDAELAGQKLDDDFETEIMFWGDDASSTSSSSSGDDDGKHDVSRHSSNYPSDEPYLMSPDMNNSIVDLEMQLILMQHELVSVCDSDEHSYHSHGNRSLDLERCLTDYVDESNDEGGLKWQGLYSSSTQCDCESICSFTGAGVDPVDPCKGIAFDAIGE